MQSAGRYVEDNRNELGSNWVQESLRGRHGNLVQTDAAETLDVASASAGLLHHVNLEQRC